MSEAYICDFTRTPIGRYAGALKDVRTDDLAAHPIRALAARNAGIDWDALDDSILGCANQAGEDNRNVARMAVLLAGLPASVPGSTINRLCGSGLDAVGSAARAIKAGEAHLMLAGGVESMTRAPFVMGKATEAFSRSAEIYDTTIGWRFVNKLMQKAYGTESMPETGENVAEEFQISRADQDRFAYNSQQKREEGAGQRVFRQGDHARHHQGPQGRHRGRARRASAPRHHAGDAGQAENPVPRSGHRHRRQRFGRQRRRGGADPGLRGRGEAAWPDAARPGGRHGHRRRGAAHHGHRPGPGGARSCWPTPACRSATST